MKKTAYCSFLLLILLNSCKKEDVIEITTIRGNVFNLCTDSSLANVTVNLVAQNSNSSTSISTVSDATGDFVFNDVSINHNSKYSYSLNVKSYSGYAGLDVGFNGDRVEIDKDNLTAYSILRVAPHFSYLCFQISPSVHITYPDSLFVSYQQNIFHKNMPTSNYRLGFDTPAVQDGYPAYSSYCLGNYWMGKWNITIDKWRSGYHSTEYDSIYIGWGATETYTINW
jgi:hypothetical protein